MLHPRRLGLPLLSLLAISLAAGCQKSSDDAPVSQAAAPESPAATAAAPAESGTASPFPETPATGPDAARRLIAASNEFLKQGQGQRALQALTAAIKADPKCIEAYTCRAELLVAADLKPQAIEDLGRALAIDTRNARLFNTRGYLRMSIDNLAGAIEDFDAAAAIDLSYPQPCNNRGLVRLAQGDTQKAIEDFDAAIRIDPNYIDAYNNRGYALTLQEDFDDAIATLTKAIELDAAYVNAWNNRGLAYHKAGKFDEAVRDFTRAIELQPSNPKYYAHRADSRYALEQTAEAHADREQAVWLERLVLVNRRVAATPQDAQVWLDRAEHMRLGRRFDAALNDIERALPLVTTGSRQAVAARVLQARICLERGEPERAVEAATEALKIGPNDFASSVRGDAYFALQNYEAAVEDYRRSRRLDDQVQQAYELRAQQLESAGQVQQAGYFREQAAALAPEKLTRTAAQTAEEASPFPELPATTETPAP